MTNDLQPRPSGTDRQGATLVTLYFDFLSPYAYLARHRLCQLAEKHGWRIAYRAIDLGRVKLAIGNTGPANREMPIKLAHLNVDLQRWARIYGITLKFPANFRSARLNAGLYFPGGRDVETKYVRTAYELVWGQGLAPDADATSDALTEAMGWDQTAFAEFADGAEGQAALTAATEEAIRRHVFGVPTMIADGEMWWGNDRLFLLERHLTERR